MIEISGLAKSYNGRRVLSGARLTVAPGESVALVGANGSGKTTTLRCAVGLVRPDRGEIRIDGFDLWKRQRDARSRVSYLAQRTDFPPTLTVREILGVVAELRGAPPHSVEREIDECGLAPLAGRTAAVLSGGERQRVAMAALLIPEVSVYLLDEPTLNLDPTGTRLLIERLRALRDRGCALLFTTHVNGELETLATRVALVSDGQFLPVGQEACAGERHVSLAAGDRPELWIDAALRAGAARAWAMHGRLHAVVGDAAFGGLLARLAREGAAVSAFRTETALATALDRLNHEEHHTVPRPVDRVDRCTAAGELWRQARWAGADPAGPR